MHNHFLFLDNLGGGELMVIVLFVLIFFGSDKIPGIMKGLGKAMREFKTTMDDVRNDIETSVQEPVQSLKRDLNQQINSAQEEVNKVIEDTSKIEEPKKETP